MYIWHNYPTACKMLSVLISWCCCCLVKDASAFLVLRLCSFWNLTYQSADCQTSFKVYKCCQLAFILIWPTFMDAFVIKLFHHSGPFPSGVTLLCPAPKCCLYKMILHQQPEIVIDFQITFLIKKLCKLHNMMPKWHLLILSNKNKWIEQTFVGKTQLGKNIDAMFVCPYCVDAYVNINACKLISG